MNLESVKLLAKGDTDIELFDIVMKHIRAAQKETDEVIAKRKKNVEVVQDDDSAEEELEDDQLCVQSDGGVLRNKKYNPQTGGGVRKRKNPSVGADGAVMKNNKYGASGSSAGYSDSEILGIKAPFVKRPPWRPRNNRFYAGFETKKKQWKNKNSKKKETREIVDNLEVQDGSGKNNGGEGSGKKKKASKREIKCGKCFLKGHNATQCCSLPVTDATAASYFDE